MRTAKQPTGNKKKRAVRSAMLSMHSIRSTVARFFQRGKHNLYNYNYAPRATYFTHRAITVASLSFYYL